MPNLISLRELSKKDILELLDSAEKIEDGKVPNHKGKILATLFFEASTRTRMSFQSAALRLGMTYIDLAPESSSLKKGETFADTVRVVEGYADVLAIRHPKEGSVRLAGELTHKPVINAGDGANQHPTQTLIDLYTIKKCKGKLNGLTVAFLGDLKHARVVRSLVYALSMFGNSIRLIAPENLELDEGVIKEVKAKYDADITVTKDLKISDADVIYITRIQEERFADPYEAKRVREQFKLTQEMLENTKKDLIIMHALPRVDEMDHSIDSLPCAKYFEEAHNGVPVRMAVIDYVLRIK